MEILEHRVDEDHQLFDGLDLEDLSTALDEPSQLLENYEEL